MSEERRGRERGRGRGGGRRYIELLMGLERSVNKQQNFFPFTSWICFDMWATRSVAYQQNIKENTQEGEGGEGSGGKLGGEWDRRSKEKGDDKNKDTLSFFLAEGCKQH